MRLPPCGGGTLVRLCAGAGVIGLLALTLVGPATATRAVGAVVAPLKIYEAQIDSYDPALAYTPASWQVLNATCAGLVGWKDGTADSKTLFPDAAKTLPTVTNGGKTYTFTIRSGLGFSPPATGTVTPGSFVRAIQRAAKVPNSPAGQYLSLIQGFDAYASGAAASISGLGVSGNTLTITLTQATGSFLSLLATPWFCAVPATTPATQQTTVPSAGPYYISTADDQGNATLLQNPNYGGTRPRASAEIDISTTSDDPISDVESGALDADFAFSGALSSQFDSLYAQYGPGHSPQQAFKWPGSEVDYLGFDIGEPTLATAAGATARKAIATGINRDALAQIQDSQPGSNFLSPDMPGYTGPSVYNLAGDVPTAQSLMAGAGFSAGHQLTLTFLARQGSPTATNLYPALKAELAKFYINLTLQAVPSNQYFETLLTSTTWDIALLGWIADFPDPWDNLQPVFGTNGSGNLTRFSSPTFDSQLANANASTSESARVAALGSLANSLATGVYGGGVPAAAIDSGWDYAFVSSRVACVNHGAGIVSVDLVLLQDKSLGACQSDVNEVPAGPPVNSTAPAIAGTAKVGQKLTATTGGWYSPNSVTYAFQWKRCTSTGTSCVAIAGATGTSYTVATADKTHKLVVTVTATNADGPASATSAATAVVP